MLQYLLKETKGLEVQKTADVGIVMKIFGKKWAGQTASGEGNG